ncbi:hypothetical protein MSHOH_1750 [Methanosarcina horonobensis HB-1 = JCM 15518]|uniref:Uncharacterized protein n=1 Tax=Methanosarcina horonobensis HB-1 = JCM 15518 TaxID=1434110 RepID=A0A0E3SFG7_9EURY|nr:hypothetical protein MSHOH_1750 [Methanosarcina horonobensis HB-1 = JCM 15518]
MSPPANLAVLPKSFCFLLVSYLISSHFHFFGFYSLFSLFYGKDLSPASNMTVRVPKRNSGSETQEAKLGHKELRYPNYRISR